MNPRRVWGNILENIEFSPCKGVLYCFVCSDFLPTVRLRSLFRFFVKRFFKNKNGLLVPWYFMRTQHARVTIYMNTMSVKI